MKKLFSKSIFIYLVVFLCAVVLLITTNRFITGGTPTFGRFSSNYASVYPATVYTVLGQTVNDQGVGVETQIHFEALVSGGDRDGEYLFASQYISTTQAISQKAVEAGDKILLRYDDTGGEDGNSWVFFSYNRASTLFILVLVFLALLILFGGKKGLATILSLVLTCSCIFYCFIPSIIAGYNIFFTTILACLFVILSTLFLINGINYKSVAATLGSIGGLVAAGAIFKLMDSILRLTGLVDENSTYLLSMGVSIDLKSVIFASILIGVLGGVLDVGVSIVSPLAEIYPLGSVHDFKSVVKSGINIGQDIICTMTNTIILAYIGSSLSSTILLIVYSNSFLELINREEIIIEILQAVIGSIGLLFTIPISILVYAIGVSRPRANHPANVEKTDSMATLENVKPLEVRSVPKELHN